MDQSTINKVVESKIRKEIIFPANVEIFLRDSMEPAELIIYNKNEDNLLIIPMNGLNIRKETNTMDLDNLVTLGKFNYTEKSKETLFKLIMICFERYNK